MRINRFLSQAGYGSRRAVEGLVRGGRVHLNGEVVQDLATRVETGDEVRVDGKRVRAAAPGRVVLFNKPFGVVCSFAHQGTSPCLNDVLPARIRKGRLFHIGRLDRDSTGALLLSDDGTLAHALLHPSRPVWKRYAVALSERLPEEALKKLKSGKIRLDGRRLAPARIRPRGKTAVYTFELREGKNRQIRRMVAAVGGKVRSLHREAFGPIELDDLAVGRWRELNSQEVGRLRDLTAGER